MENFRNSGSTLAGRYARAVRSADTERRDDVAPSAEFDSYVQSGFDQEIGGPTPTQDPDTAQDVRDSQFGDPGEEAVAQTKDFLLQKAKNQMSGSSTDQMAGAVV